MERQDFLRPSNVQLCFKNLNISSQIFTFSPFSSIFLEITRFSASLSGFARKAIFVPHCMSPKVFKALYLSVFFDHSLRFLKIGKLFINLHKYHVNLLQITNFLGYILLLLHCRLIFASLPGYAKQ